MKIMRRIWCVLILISLVLGCVGGLGVSADSDVEIIREGLVAWYDGSNNHNGEQDMETTVWKDLTGNGHHLPLKLDEKNYWTDNAFHVDATPNYFPDGVLEVVNREDFTVEMVLGSLDYSATDWVTLMCSDNDNVSLFIRQENNNLEYKHYNVFEDRCTAEGGGDLCDDSTLAITFEKEGEIYRILAYVDGVLLAEGSSKNANKADTLFFCHEDVQRAWSGDVYGFRFYDRALSADEVKTNAKADDRKYRSGDYYPPVQEYEQESDVEVGGENRNYRNDLITITPEVDVLSWSNAYDSAVYCYDGQWDGARMQVTDMNAVEDSAVSPEIILNYQKYVRRNGLTNLKGEDVNAIVLKVSVEGDMGDLTLWGMSGRVYSWYEGAFYVDSIFGGPESTGEVEYMIYEVEGMWDGEINSLIFTPQEYEDAVFCLHEVAFFKDIEAAFAYAGESYWEDDNTEKSTAAADTDAADTEASETAVSDDDGTADTSADETDTTKMGCGSAVSLGAATIVLAAAGMALKKKD